MPFPTTIRSLRVRPRHSADLSFNMPGILRAQNATLARLGAPVTPFDFERLYARFNETEAPGSGIVEGARLKYGSRAIADSLSGGAAPAYLFALRNGPLGSSLDQYIERREAAFLERFRWAKESQARLETSSREVSSRLRALLEALERRMKDVDAAYKAAPVGVVKKTTTVSESAPGAFSMTESSSETAATATWTTGLALGQPPGTPAVTEVKSGGAVQQTHESAPYGSIPLVPENNAWVLPKGAFIPSQKAVSRTVSAGQQRMESDLAAYSHPELDNLVAHHQLLAAAHNELIRQELGAFRAPHLERIYGRELAGMDQEIRAVQMNFAHTYLCAPFAGVVTAVYKDVGESVEPGEPVLRIETTDRLLLVGQIQARRPLRVGMKGAVEVSDLFEAGKKVPFAAEVVAVRGHESGNDEWEVVLGCDNPVEPDGMPLLPLNYELDGNVASFVMA